MSREIKKRGRPCGMRAIQLELQEELYNPLITRNWLIEFMLLPLMITIKTKLLA